MHPLGRSDKRALKLPLLSFNGVIDLDSMWHVCGSLGRETLLECRCYRQILTEVREEKIFPTFRARFFHFTHASANVHSSRLESSAFIHVPRARPGTTAHQTQPGRNTPRECVICYRVLHRTDLPGGKEQVVKDVCENDYCASGACKGFHLHTKKKTRNY